MLRTLFIEFVLPFLLYLFVRSLFRSIFPGSRKAPPQKAAPREPAVVAGGELKKDPVCGTYVSTALSVTRTVNGELVHFCSRECRDKSLASMPASRA
jgi:YHS domain-containing protein